MGSEIPPKLREVAHFQGGVVTRKQALRAGVASGAIISKVRYGRWRQVYHGVYAIYTGPLSRAAQLWAAVLYAGREAELSHETAAELHGLTGGPSQLIHISIPPSRRVQSAPGLKIHISVRAGATCFQRGVLPHSSIEDTILDLIEAAESLDGVREWITAGRRATGDRPLRAAARKRKRMRWRREFEEIVAAAARTPTPAGSGSSGTAPPRAPQPQPPPPPRAAPPWTQPPGPAPLAAGAHPGSA